VKLLALVRHFLVEFILDFIFTMACKVGEDEVVGDNSTARYSFFSSHLLLLFENSVVDSFKNIFL